MEPGEKSMLLAYMCLHFKKLEFIDRATSFRLDSVQLYNPNSQHMLFQTTLHVISNQSYIH